MFGPSKLGAQVFQPRKVMWAKCWAHSGLPEGHEAIELAMEDLASCMDILGKQSQKLPPCICAADGAPGRGAGRAGPADQRNLCL